MLFNGPKKAATTLVMAHGAGAGMNSPFMTTFAEGLSARGIRVVRFEFPYMTASRVSGRKRPPDREQVLIQTFGRVISQLSETIPTNQIALGGKSMGGRMASLYADRNKNSPFFSLICLGYPFHPAGKPNKLRTKHLENLNKPTLIVQGERDYLGARKEVEGYPLSNSIQLHWCPDGNHDLTPRKSSDFNQASNWNNAMDVISIFLASH